MITSQHHIHRAIGLVRRGDFIGAATDPVLMGNLAAIHGDSDPASDLDWLTCQALLAEINDQTGQYEKVAGIFSNPETQHVVQRSLGKSRERFAAGNRIPRISDLERRLVRARVHYLLQASIHRLRTFDSGLDVARRVMADCWETMDAVSSAQGKIHGSSSCRFHSALSLLHYWQGRVEMARNRFPEALDHFNKSMRETEKNLDFHYSGTSPSIRPGDERMSYASYSLASAMAFGVAHVNHMSGHLTQALALLQPASAILMGTGDNYRRGYAQMLIGAAERALAGREEKGLLRAVRILEGSLEMFAGTNDHQLRHGLHQARSHHQLAIAHTYLAQILTRDSSAKDADLRRANNHLQLASNLLIQFQDAGFVDPELRYDLYITKSRILREQGEYEKARSAAKAALRIATEYLYAPAFSRAKAHLASAETDLAQLNAQANNPDLLNRADFHVKEAIRTCESNAAIAAITHLYEARILVKCGQKQRARQKFREGWLRYSKQVQNGWVRQLSEELELETKPPEAEFSINLEALQEELAARAEQGVHLPLWDEAINQLERFMIDWSEKTTLHEPFKRVGLKAGRWFNNKRRLRGE